MRDTINRCTLAGDRDFMLGSLERLDRNVRYMDGIVSNLNEYARPTPPKRSPVRMQSLISEALDRTAILERYPSGRTWRRSLPRWTVR
jgi:hypothetical protein